MVLEFGLFSTLGCVWLLPSTFVWLCCFAFCVFSVFWYWFFLRYSFLLNQSLCYLLLGAQASMIAKKSGLSAAPPTRNPSMFGLAISSGALEPFTEPP